MGSGMELSEETLNTIGGYVKQHLAQWFHEVVPQPIARMDPQYIERMVRVEESIERQQALMKQGFDHMERRFEEIDKRFEQIDKRFDQIDRRFEQIDRRFEQIDKRFEDVQKQIGRQTILVGSIMSVLLGVVIYGVLGV